MITYGIDFNWASIPGVKKETLCETATYKFTIRRNYQYFKLGRKHLHYGTQINIKMPKTIAMLYVFVNWAGNIN